MIRVRILAFALCVGLVTPVQAGQISEPLTVGIGVTVANVASFDAPDDGCQIVEAVEQDGTVTILKAC